MFIETFEHKKLSAAVNIRSMQQIFGDGQNLGEKNKLKPSEIKRKSIVHSLDAVSWIIFNGLSIKL